jgi:hypothetical protein
MNADRLMYRSLWNGFELTHARYMEKTGMKYEVLTAAVMMLPPSGI